MNIDAIIFNAASAPYKAYNNNNNDKNELPKFKEREYVAISIRILSFSFYLPHKIFEGAITGLRETERLIV